MEGGIHLSPVSGERGVATMSVVDLPLPVVAVGASRGWTSMPCRTPHRSRGRAGPRRDGHLAAGRSTRGRAAGTWLLRNRHGRRHRLRRPEGGERRAVVRWSVRRGHRRLSRAGGLNGLPARRLPERDEPRSSRPWSVVRVLHLRRRNQCAGGAGRHGRSLPGHGGPAGAVRAGVAGPRVRRTLPRRARAAGAPHRRGRQRDLVPLGGGHAVGRDRVGLAPPYWISMGAVAITVLAGAGSSR
jgi:hypothetical protein